MSMFVRANAARSPIRYADRVEVTAEEFDRLNQQRRDVEATKQIIDAGKTVIGAIGDAARGPGAPPPPAPRITPIQIGLVVAVVGAVAWFAFKK